MSYPALLNAVKSAIIAYGNANLLSGDSVPWVDNQTISVEEDDRPPPEVSGFRDFYVVVHPGSWNSGNEQDSNPGLDEVFGVNVTVARKIGTRPITKIYDAAYVDAKCLYNRIRQVMLAVNWSYALIATANTSLTGNKFVEPLRWKRTEQPFRVEDGSWLINASEKAIANNLLLVSTIEFGGARRIQCITDPPN